jgi:hypothetical protein
VVQECSRDVLVKEKLVVRIAERRGWGPQIRLQSEREREVFRSAHLCSRDLPLARVGTGALSEWHSYARAKTCCSRTR